MTAGNFAPSVAKVKGYEGGFINLAKDPGGATNWGVTQAALAAHRGHAVTVADVRALTWDEAQTIYHTTYWPSVQGDQLPSGIDLMLFDGAVNCGRGRAVTFLQAALGVTQDGALGPWTLSHLADHKADLVNVVGRIKVARAAYYRALKTFDTFGAGWMERLTDVAHTATGWAARTGARQ